VAAAKAIARWGRRAKEKGVARVVFDRGGFAYHGRIKAVPIGRGKRDWSFNASHSQRIDPASLNLRSRWLPSTASPRW